MYHIYDLCVISRNMNKNFTYEKNENMNIVDVTAIGDIEKKTRNKNNWRYNKKYT